MYTTVCGVSIGSISFSCNTYTTNDETLEKSARLRQDAKDWRMEIAKYRANLDIVKMKLEMPVLSIPEASETRRFVRLET